METYIDENGMTNDKPCKNGKQSCGNVLIYTAYRQKLMGDVDINKVSNFFQRCIKFKENIGWELSRYPREQSTKGSREEIIGAISLLRSDGIYELLEKFNYRYNYQWLDFPWYKQLKGFIYIIGEHRNFAQDNNVEYCFPLMFKLPPQDIYYINKMQNKPTNLFYLCMFNLYALSTILQNNLYALSTILQNNISATNVLTLQLEDLKSKFWIRFIDKKTNYKKYFSEDHVFNKGIE